MFVSYFVVIEMLFLSWCQHGFFIGDMQRYVESRKSYQTREPFQLSENLSRAQQGIFSLLD